MERQTPQPDRIPKVLTREHATKPEEIISLATQQEAQEYIEKVLKYIHSPQFKEQIDRGHVTFAMLRPHAEANTKKLTDSAMYQKIKDRIHEEQFNILQELSFYYSLDFVDSFYSGGPKDIMQTLPPTNKEKFHTKWEEFIDSMTSGPTTAFILYYEGNAITRWRETIGPTNPEHARIVSLNSLRAQFATTMNNNLVHGSDSIESVKRELELLSKELINRYTDSTSAFTPDLVG